MLEELEPIFDACLIASEQEASTVLGLSRLCLLLGDFWSKLDTSTHDASEFDGNGCYGCWWYLEVVSGVSLSNVCGERAA